MMGKKLQRPGAKGSAKLPSWFMEHAEYNVLHVESEQQKHKIPMKGQAIVPQWWMDVTPHDRLDLPANNKAREEDNVSVLSEEETYAEILVPRREPISPLTLHSSSPSWDLESRSHRLSSPPGEVVKVTVFGDGTNSLDNISQIMDPSTPSSSFAGAVPDLDMTESGSESELNDGGEDDRVQQVLEVQSDPGFVKRVAMELNEKHQSATTKTTKPETKPGFVKRAATELNRKHRQSTKTAAKDQDVSETMSTTHPEASESSSWIGRDHHKPLKDLPYDYAKPKVVSASAKSLDEIWIKAQRNMSFSYTRRRTLLEEPALNYQNSPLSENEEGGYGERAGAAVVTPERIIPSCGYELGSQQEI